jgi:hypothetical protein
LISPGIAAEALWARYTDVVKSVAVIPILIALMLVSAFSSEESIAAETGGCIKAKLHGVATTYDPRFAGWMTGGPKNAFGEPYNPNDYRAALKLSYARKYKCGSGAKCHAAVEGNGKAMIVLIDDNGPMCDHAATAQNAQKVGDCMGGSTDRIIDLNAKSMAYMSGGKYTPNSGTIKGVTVTLLCDFDAKLGPLDEKERAEWAKKSFDVPVTDVSGPSRGLLESAPVGSPTSVGSPAQSAYRQPADYSNYHSPSPTQVSPYFSPQQQGGGAWTLPQTPIYQSSSTADYLLNLISGTTTQGTTTTTPRRVIITPGTIGRVASSTTEDTVVVTPLTPIRPQQTFAPAQPVYGESPAPVVSVLADMVRQLQMIFERIAAFFRRS